MSFNYLALSIKMCIRDRYEEYFEKPNSHKAHMLLHTCLLYTSKQISVKENTTIMEAAASNGIPIPHLCYLKEINEIAACRVCVVELEGKDRLITSCNNVVKEGMVIHTNSCLLYTSTN